MTLDKLVYDIREALRDYSDDSELDNRYIEYLIAVKRSKFLRQELDRFGRKFNNTVLQSFCLGVETVNAADCGITVGCDKVARTIQPIPSPVQLSSRDAIYRVAPTSKLSEGFTLVDRNTAIYAKYSIFSNKTKMFLHSDDYLYFVNKSGVFHFDCVNISGIFEDPVEVSKYSDCCDCENPSPCYDPYSDPYPMSPHLIDVVRSEIIKELAGTMTIPEDKQNDTQDG